MGGQDLMDRVVTKERSHILRRKIFNLCAGEKKERRERRRKVLELLKISQSSATCLRQV